MEDLIIAREAAYGWARARFEELFGPAYVDQCRDADEWEERVDVPERDKWMTCRRVRTAASKDEAADDLKAAAMLRVREVVELPDDMRLVLRGRQDITTPCTSIAEKLTVPTKVLANYEKLEAELQAEAKLAADDVAMDLNVDQGEEAPASEAEGRNLTERLEGLRAEAAQFREDMKKFAAGLSTKATVKSEDDELFMGKVLAGAVVLNEETGVYESADQLLTKYQKQDRVDRDRCRRFIKYVLQDWKTALKEGHDVTLGTCFLASWGGPKSFAVVRVGKMYCDSNQQAYSLKLDKKNRKQQFRVELLSPVGCTEAGSQLYRASGWQVGPLAASSAIELIDLLPMRDVAGITREQAMHDALLPVESILAMRRKGFTQVALDLEGTLAALSATRGGHKLVLKKDEGWSSKYRCYWCKTSWYDHRVGKLVKCTTCYRAFHQQHATPIIKNNIDDATWVCQICLKTDPDVCSVCQQPFTEEEVNNPNSMENNELVRCVVCAGWWHQACHIPSLYPLPIGDWRCSKCEEEHGARPKGGKAAAAASTATRKKAAAAKKAAAPIQASAKAGPAPTPKSALAEAESQATTAAITIGSLVEVLYEGGGVLYPGSVSAENDNGTVDILYDDGDVEEGVSREFVQINVKATAAQLATATLAGDGEGRARRSTAVYGPNATVSNLPRIAEAPSTRNNRLSW